MFSEGLDRKVTQSILLIRHAYRHCKHRGEVLELAYSGGKDSDVLLELCRMGGVLGDGVIVPLHRCTTIDPPYTLRHCMDNGVRVLRPKKSFRDCVLQSGLPSRFKRHCCGVLKEFRVYDYVLVGIRRCESAKRCKLYREPEVCRSYSQGGSVIQYLPLLEWGDDDIREFVDVRNLSCHPLYYDDDGVFHVERRLGCMGCCLQSPKKRQEDFVRHKGMVRFYVNLGREYLRTHPQVKTHEYFDDAYEWFVCDVFCKGVDDFVSRFKERGVDCKRYLEKFFDIVLD